MENPTKEANYTTIFADGSVILENPWIMGYAGLMSVTYPNNEKVWLDWLKKEAKEIK